MEEPYSSEGTRHNMYAYANHIIVFAWANLNRAHRVISGDLQISFSSLEPTDKEENKRTG